jgi:hypothetical protein
MIFGGRIAYVKGRDVPAMKDEDPLRALGRWN